MRAIAVRCRQDAAGPRLAHGVAERRVDLRVGLVDVLVRLGEDSDHRPRRAAELNRVPDDRGIRREAPRPQSIREEDDLRPAKARGLNRLVLVGDEVAAEHGVHAECAEVIPGDARAVEPFGRARVGQRRDPRRDRRQRLERRGVRTDVLHRGEAGRDLVPVLVALPDVDESIRVVVRERPDEQRIDDAEDRGRGSDGECQRHGAERGESRSASEEPRGVTQVGKE